MGKRSRACSKFMLDGNENPLENDGSEVRLLDKRPNIVGSLTMDQTAGCD
jgi:hypothetical protein